MAAARRHLAGWLLGILLLGSCAWDEAPEVETGPEPEPELPAGGEVNIFDLAEEGRLLAPSTAPLLSVDVGEGEIERGVRAAVTYGEGLVLTNSFVRQVLFLDRGGRVVSRQGRDGFGPGEYMNPGGVALLDGHPVVWDAYHRKISRLPGSGTPLREVVLVDSTPRYFSGDLIGAFGDVVFLRFDPSGYQGAPTDPIEARQDAHFLLVDVEEGATRGRWILPGPEQWVARVDRNHGGLPVVFGRRPVAAVAHGRAYTADTEALLLSVYGTHGPLGTVALRGADPIVTKARWVVQARDSARAHVVDVPPGIERSGESAQLFGSLAAFRTALLDAGLPARETLPAFSDMMGSSDGRYLWIRPYPVPGDTAVIWVGLDDSLRPAHHVRVPVDMEVWEISEHHLLAWSPGWGGRGRLSLHSLEEVVP